MVKRKKSLPVVRLLALTLAFTAMLAGCDPKMEVALYVAEVPLEEEMFLYFYDTVRTHPGAYGLVRNSPHKQVAEQAVVLCTQYMTVNTRFTREREVLSSQQKATVSANVNTLWQLYGEYYTEIGLSKQALMKAETTKAYQDRLFLNLYDSSGTQAVPESQIQQYFNENYLVFRVIHGYFSETDETGQSVPISKAASDKLRNEFKEMAQSLRDGGNIHDVNSAFLDTQSSEVPITVLKKGSQSYSDAFFQDVKKLTSGEPAVLEYADDGYIFLVVREKVDFDKGEQYQSNRIDCLKGLKEEQFLQELREQALSHTVRRNESVISRAATLPKPTAG